MDLEARILAVRLRYGQVRIGTGISDPIAGIWAFELEYRPQGWDLGFKAGIRVLGLGFGPSGWGLGLDARIRASRLRFGPRGPLSKEKIILMFNQNKTISEFLVSFHMILN